MMLNVIFSVFMLLFVHRESKINVNIRIAFRKSSLIFLEKDAFKTINEISSFNVDSPQEAKKDVENLNANNNNRVTLLERNTLEQKTKSCVTLLRYNSNVTTFCH